MMGEPFTCVTLRIPSGPMVKAPEESITGFIGLPTHTGFICILSNQIPIYRGPADPSKELGVISGVKNPSLKIPLGEISCSQSLSICPGFMVLVSAGEETQKTAPRKPITRKRRTRTGEEAIGKQTEMWLKEFGIFGSSQDMHWPKRFKEADRDSRRIFQGQVKGLKKWVKAHL